MTYSKESTRIEKDYRLFNDLCNTGICAYCGDEFKSRSPKALYCSQRCKNDTAIRRKAKRVQARRLKAVGCIVCNAPLEQPATSKIRKYCSAKCKQRGYRDKLQAVTIPVLAKREKAEK